VCEAPASIACWGSHLCSTCHTIWWNDPRHQPEAIDTAIGAGPWVMGQTSERPRTVVGYSVEATKRTEAWVLEQRQVWRGA
jgi:alkylhydroperoxidase family enzyme